MAKNAEIFKPLQKLCRGKGTVIPGNFRKIVTPLHLASHIYLTEIRENQLLFKYNVNSVR